MTFFFAAIRPRVDLRGGVPSHIWTYTVAGRSTDTLTLALPSFVRPLRPSLSSDAMTDWPLRPISAAGVSSSRATGGVITTGDGASAAGVIGAGSTTLKPFCWPA